MVEADMALSFAPGDMDLRPVRSRAELDRLKQGAAERIAFERQLSESFRERDEWTLPLFCQVCEQAVLARGDWLSSDGRTVNFRGRLICPSCELNNRQRFMAALVRSTVARGSAAVYLYEQVTPFYSWAQRDLAAAVTGSEYLGHDVVAGSVIDGIRHEDALAMTFADGSFDLVVSNDVFEHVPDIELALAECVRVLRSGGRMLFSIPFHADSDVTVKRAELRDGQVGELLPAQYHGNPIAAGGSLVFYDHGWEILDACRAAGFAEASLLAYWSPLYGYLGEGVQLMFVASL